MILFCALVIMHCLCDYPLQGDFLAKAKNHRAPIAGVPWQFALLSHAAIQAGGVWLLTGSWGAALFEFCAHAAIDWNKSEGNLSFGMDQALHVFCKLAIVLILGWAS